MTPREKAIELVSKFRPYTKIVVAEAEYIEDTKICALIAVDEIINMCKLYHNHNVAIDTKIYTELTIDYWQEVKKEIELL